MNLIFRFLYCFIANRAVETNEMWRVRQKELEVDDRVKHESNNLRSNGPSYRDGKSLGSTSNRHAVADDSANASCSSSKGLHDGCHSRKDDGLRDEELEEFLHSRYRLPLSHVPSSVSLVNKFRKEKPVGLT